MIAYFMAAQLQGLVCLRCFFDFLCFLALIWEATGWIGEEEIMGEELLSPAGTRATPTQGLPGGH